MLRLLHQSLLYNPLFTENYLHFLSEKSSTKFLLTLFFFCEDNKKQKHQASADVPLIVKIAADDFPFFRFFVSFDVNFCVASAKRTTSFCSSI